MIIPRIRIKSIEVLSIGRDAARTKSLWDLPVLITILFFLDRLIVLKSFGKYKRTCGICQ